MTRLYVADLHIGHSKIAELRSFPTTDAHDQHIKKVLRQRCNKKDVLIEIVNKETRA